MRRIKIVIGAVVAVVVLIVVVVAVYLLTRDEAPEAVDLETTVARIEAAETTGDSTDTPSATEPAGDDAGTPTADAATNVATTSSDDTPALDAAVSADDDPGSEPATADQTAESPGGLDGVWAVQVAENAGDLQGEPTVSFAGFRVDEVLAGGIGDFTAVGRTADVAGSIELSGNVLVAATVEVTMGTLRTDNSSRDSQVRRALGANDFPQAIFTLVEPVELLANMADGETFSGSAQGDLTIKGVTNQVSFDLQAQLVDDTIVAVGSSDVVFSDFGVTAPSAPIVVSVEDHGIMEFQLLFTR
ncbi:MAG: hypothetical protein F4110_05050 [Acidimicrobiaceae bacterium]|nr:hypothetical protein [Acidimicrobiaceae bacterium]MXZ98937.1 hypothetical protein [Acidimicrobiaceae bacterium]MYE75008.1 hypothetical protein [Acidimicrobiaceae bacterium]MYE97617.1 hypothetical protein [Acidimicrobiaceae bacterium]MYI53339.1 hypothetical protein [Acidimicrobiaceae bacterium]